MEEVVGSIMPSSPTTSIRGDGELRQILLNEPHPSIAPEEDQPTEDAIQETEKKKVSPKVKKTAIKKCKKRAYKYKDLIYHLDFECLRNKVYTCPQKCNSKRIQKKLTKKQVELHLTKDCPKVEVQCETCGETFLREV